MTLVDENELYRFKVIVATIALEHPDMSMRDGIRLALEMEEQLAHQPELMALRSSPSVTDPLDIAQWIWDHKLDAGPSKIIGHITAARVGAVGAGKIHAIKEARAVTGAGLKEAKEAVEILMDSLPARPVSRTTPRAPF